MQHIEWEDGFNIGIDEIDVQHQALVSIINGLADAIETRASSDIYKAIFNQLIDYTDYHFSAEEKYIRKLTKKDKRLHLLQHQNFINELFRLNCDDFDRESATSIWFFLSDWLISHIVSEDIKLSKRDRSKLHTNGSFK